MSTRSLLELILLAALWGASFLFMRIATPEFGAIALIEIRVLVAALFLLPIWWFKEAKTHTQNVKENAIPILVVGILNSAIPFVLFAYSTLYVTGGFASVINSTAPIWAAIVAWLWLQRKPSFDSTIGLACGVIGVTILVSGALSVSADSIGLGIVAALGATVLYGIAANYISENLGNVSSLSISTFSQVGAALVLLPLAIFYFPSGEISMRSWASVIVLGVFCTGFAYTLYFRLIANVGSDKAITVTFLIPVFGSGWGALFIGEAISLTMIIGTLIILTGTALVTGVVSLKK